MFVKKIVPLIIIQFLFISCSTNSIDDLDNTEYIEQSLKKLINSINNQDTNRINSLLLKKPSLSNYQELKYGITPLLIAIKNEKYRSAKSLLKLGANPNLCSFDGESPLTCVLHNVISEKSKGFIKHLLEAGADLNYIESNIDDGEYLFETTPLIIVSGEGEIELVNYFISHGANVNLGTYNNSYFPISEALLLSQIEVVEILCTTPNFKMPQIVYETKDIHGDIVKVDFIMALNSMNLKNDSIKKQIQQRLKSMF